MSTKASTPRRSRPIDCCSIGESGCEVVGFVAAADCTSDAPQPTDDAFVSWIDRGYRLEDWESLVPFDTDPAA
ncbi:MAG: hypothetical protein GY720_08280 [bacterium]|nr:hypothetical protein [bacterium]